MEKFCVDV
jgi:hypothetical protein